MPETVYQHDGVTIYHADALAVLSELETASIDALVTDPPAGIAFMGQAWDAFGGKPAKDRRAEQERYRDQYGKGASAYGHPHKSAKPKAGEREAFIAAMSAILAEAVRVLKPGAHGLVWALPRTSHWTAMALENAGFEIRDCVYHLFGTGFPKSRDVSKAIDKAAGAERSVVGEYHKPSGATAHFDEWQPRVDTLPFGYATDRSVTAPATELAAQWDGYGTALKPAVECWWLVRKPLSEKTVEANVLKHGTGALNIDGCRIGTTKQVPASPRGAQSRIFGAYGAQDGSESGHNAQPGRWPANLALTHTLMCRLVGEKQVKGSRIDKPSTTGQMTSGYGGALNADRPPRGHGDADNRETVDVWECAPDCPVRMLDEQSGERASKRGPDSRSTGKAAIQSKHVYGHGFGAVVGAAHGDTGGASRFFYVGQADAEPAEPDDAEVAEVWERAPDCPVRLLDEQSGRAGAHGGHGSYKQHSWMNQNTSQAITRDDTGGASRFYYVAKASKKERRKSKHPTIKSVALMRWLVRLITPPGGTVLDCFAGSGATVEACLREQRAVIAIDREREYVDDILARVADYHVTPERALGGGRQ